jgi:hypothetical protein
MSDSTFPVPGASRLAADEFAAIEQAVTETERGRWFLLEYARRQRASETQRLLDAIARLESVVTRGPAAAIADTREAPQPVALPADAVGMAQHIAGELDGILRSLREAGASQFLCDALDVQVRALARLSQRQAGSVPEVVTKAVMGPIVVPSPDEPHKPVDVSDPKPTPTFPRDAVLAALSDLDALSLQDRLALFS